MLSDAKITTLYCIVDDLLKAMRHYEDERYGSVMLKSLQPPLFRCFTLAVTWKTVATL